MNKLSPKEFSEKRQEFLELYPKVMFPNGDVRLCGRELCKKLIQLANQLDSSTTFGNLKTGQINTCLMMKLNFIMQ